MNVLNNCAVCHTESVEFLINFGQQPLSNRFLSNDNEEFLYQLALGACRTCGLAQLINPPSPAEVRSRYSWITYNEPESHLDSVVENIKALPDITKDSPILGLTYKDTSILDRLKRQGFKHLRVFDLNEDLAITQANAGLETIQERLCQDNVLSAAEPPHVLIVRHVLEHAHDTMAFLHALKNIVDPEGYIILEIPDNENILRRCDYTFIWEEHIAYFTENTFRTCLAKANLSLVKFSRYPYPYESSLVAIVRPSSQKATVPEANKKEMDLLTNFQFSWPARKESYRKVLAEAKVKCGSKGIAMMGAGHQAIAFINLFEIKDLIDVVIDDHPEKIGLRLPGSRLPIVDSSILNQDQIKFCLTSLSPESETKVRAKKQAYLESGGEFYSIFCAATNFFHSALVSRRSI